MAVDGVGNAFTWNGAAWSSASSVDVGNYFTSVSCPSASSCVAVDNLGNAFTWSEATWSSATGIDGGNYLTSVSCATELICVAVDDSGYAVMTTAAATATSSPGAPTIGAVTAKSNSAVVHWSAPSTNGVSTITGYTVSAGNVTKSSTRTNACPTSVASTATSCTVTGLTNGNVYTFKVAAINSAGTGPFSASSNRVTPKASGKMSGNTSVGKCTLSALRAHIAKSQQHYVVGSFFKCLGSYAVLEHGPVNNNGQIYGVAPFLLHWTGTAWRQVLNPISVCGRGDPAGAPIALVHLACVS
jgi:hypothetical protein